MDDDEQTRAAHHKPQYHGIAEAPVEREAAVLLAEHVSPVLHPVRAPCAAALRGSLS